MIKRFSTKASIRLLSVLFTFLSLGTFAQDSSFRWFPKEYSQKGNFSFYWGYNRSVFGKSNIHFSGPNFEFTVHDVTASDRPTPLSTQYIDPRYLSIPQYVYRLGFFPSNRLRLSVGLDHMKYVVDQEQIARISGYISPAASEKYQGTYFNEEIQLTQDFLKFEHSDGFNAVTFDADYHWPLMQFAKDRFVLNAYTGLGGFIIVAKTMVSVMEYGIDNRFHIAGYTMSAKAGLKLDFKKYLFFEVGTRAGYASMFDILIHNDAPERAFQDISYLEGFAALGTHFRFWKRKA